MCSVFDPSNTFDAEGLTQITEFTQSRKKKRNDIEKDTEVSIRNKNLQSIKQTLEIEKEEEFSKYQQKREIEQQRAIENTETIKTKSEKEKESELAEISSQKDIEIARIGKKDFVEMEKYLLNDCLNWHTNVTTPYHFSDCIQSMGCLFWSDLDQDLIKNFEQDKSC